MAMAGSAIGLGNIWRFPYMVGQHGGAVFILIYILCGLLISLPAFISESLIGRKAATSCYNSLDRLAPHTKWKYTGYLAFFGCIVVASYYGVVGGWSAEYLFQSCVHGFHASTEVEATSIFNSIAGSVFEPLVCFTVFLALSVLIVSRGMTAGVGRFTKWSTPMLFVIIVLIVAYSVSLPGSEKGIEYLLKPDWSKLTFRTCAFAMGQSFFSMSLGMGTVLVYSSFMKKEESILKVSSLTFVFDTLFAIIAGFAIMPAVFAAGIPPGAGPSLVFETLPYIFTKMGLDSPVLSRGASVLFFLTIFLAALSSAISIVVVCVEHLVDRHGWTRKKASWLFFFAALVLGTFCSLSFGLLSGVTFRGLNIFSICDTMASNYVMVTIALVFVLFIGWKLPKPVVYDEFTNNGTLKVSARVFPLIHFIIKWVLPLLIVVIFIFNLL